jgi:hypothetical protein
MDKVRFLKVTLSTWDRSLTGDLLQELPAPLIGRLNVVSSHRRGGVEADALGFSKLGKR